MSPISFLMHSHASAAQPSHTPHSASCVQVPLLHRELWRRCKRPPGGSTTLGLPPTSKTPPPPPPPPPAAAEPAAAVVELAAAVVALSAAATLPAVAVAVDCIVAGQCGHAGHCMTRPQSPVPQRQLRRLAGGRATRIPLPRPDGPASPQSRASRSTEPAAGWTGKPVAATSTTVEPRLPTSTLHPSPFPRSPFPPPRRNPPPPHTHISMCSDMHVLRSLPSAPVPESLSALFRPGLRPALGAGELGPETTEGERAASSGIQCP